jgi:hypothetical protein
MNNIIWSKGPFINAYSKLDTETIINADGIKMLINASKGIIWIRNTSCNNQVKTDLDLFANNIHLLKIPSILITSDGDRPVPSSYNKTTIHKILNSSFITKWYTQNYDRSTVHPKLNYFPIGFDLHTKEWLINDSIEKKLEYMMYCRKSIKNKIKNKIFSDTHLSLTHLGRKQLYDKIKHNKNIDFLSEKKSFFDITQIYNRYLFVVSPRGAGFDCHRTWELFMAGCIVIMKTSPLDKMFIDNKFPVVILNSWDVLNTDLPNKLLKWEKALSPFTDPSIIFPKLLFQYWLR